MNVKLYAHINQWAERCQARKWFQLSAVSRLIISMVSTYFFSFLCSSSYCLFGKIFFLRFMTFDFEWVCLRKSENIMSDACCLVLFFFLLFHRFESCWCVWCWQAFCYFVNFQFAEMIFLLIFFGAFHDNCLPFRYFSH